MSFAIAGRPIGPDHPPYVICELSGNHNGSLERALAAMIDAWHAATGCDAIKLQTYTPDTITLDSDAPDFRITEGPWAGQTLHQLYAEAYTPYDWHAALFARAAQRGVTIFSTPFDATAVELLESLGAPAYKIASFEAVDLPLIERVAACGKPMIISTGLASLAEMGDALEAAQAAGAGGVALLHCVSSYPAPIEEANVRTVPDLAERFGVVTGLSDHTPGSAAAVAAVALGAAIIEKHFTLARADGGPDAAFSLEPAEFTALVRDCKAAWSAPSAQRPTTNSASERAAAGHRRLALRGGQREGGPGADGRQRALGAAGLRPRAKAFAGGLGAEGRAGPEVRRTARLEYASLAAAPGASSHAYFRFGHRRRVSGPGFGERCLGGDGRTDLPRDSHGGRPERTRRAVSCAPGHHRPDHLLRRLQRAAAAHIGERRRLPL